VATKDRHVGDDGPDYCCFIGCPEDAEWDIVDGDGPTENTQSCTKHIEALKASSASRVYPIDNRRRSPEELLEEV
jgi:hypothetical protein